MSGASDELFWVVEECWATSWYCPEPPHPTWQLELLFWVWLAVWVVLDVFDAVELAVFVLFCDADGSPLLD